MNSCKEEQHSYAKNGQTFVKLWGVYPTKHRLQSLAELIQLSMIYSVKGSRIQTRYLIWYSYGVRAYITKTQDSGHILFDSMAELLQFSLATRNALVSSLSGMENELAASFKEEIAAAQRMGVSSLRKKVGDFNAADEELLELLKTPDLDISPLSTVGSTQLPEDIARDHIISKLYKLTNPESTFRATQLRIMNSMAPSSSRKLEDLSPLMRALLAAASFLPYLITRPFSRKMSVNRYILDIDGMRTSLHEIIGKPWVDTLSKQVQAHLREQNTKGKDIIDHAIATGLAASTREPHYPSGLPSVILPDDTVYGILADYINMVAVEMAFEYIADRLANSLSTSENQQIKTSLSKSTIRESQP
jgi:hypothetical protein